MIDEDDRYYAKAVVIATGASEKLLGIDGESRLIGRGVSSCATCDGAFFKNKDVIVIGGGDTALEDASFLTRFANQVNIVHRREQLRASKIMQNRVFENKKIRFIWNSTLESILGENKVTGVKLKNLSTNQSTEMSTDGVFVAIGRKPNTEIFRGILNMDEMGYILTAPKSTQTNIPGVFACGNVQDPYYRQVVTSAGSGCMAAIDVEYWIEEHLLEG